MIERVAIVASKHVQGKLNIPSKEQMLKGNVFLFWIKTFKISVHLFEYFLLLFNLSID